LVLRRVLSREGRHRQWVNGALVTAAQLKDVAEALVDFTGQHANQQLLRPGAQLALLDAYADNGEALEQMQGCFDAAEALAKELMALRQADAEKDRRVDLVRFYLDEIASIAPVAGEDEQLQAEQKRLRNAGRLTQAFADASRLLSDGGDDALARLQHAALALGRAAQDVARGRPLGVLLDDAVAIVDDVARTLARRAATINDPARLAEVDDRLDGLKRLMRKHGGDLVHVLATRDALQQELLAIEGASARIAELEVRLVDALVRATDAADALTARRRAAAKKLAAAVVSELPGLGMPGARLDVQLADLPRHADDVLVRADKRGLSRNGSDHLNMLFSANPGEPVASFAKVASGGELSRVLLAVKRAVLERDPVPVSIFDEVDAGVGGAVADAIGERLLAIASDRQVLCITHLPQIAACADRHIVVEKAIAHGRSVSRVRPLSDDERVAELARMLGGKVVTETTTKHAAEMLSNARADKRRSKRGEGGVAARDDKKAKKRSA
jgi:DNA repair protein RecN (Recombination protein N)